MGHEIGLHVEPSIPDVLQEDPLQFCDRQKASLEAAIGRPIIGMSTHEPVRMGDPELIEKLVDRWGLEYHAYEKRFLRISNTSVIPVPDGGKVASAHG